ncbi:unnamed protein product [Paramecium octaurelia]|uniref:EGF-like domain-containing protein n=1 Tax=Paramecium octaurelia TaxID=43137 RepID=A0A8S1Y6F5_PAROT|nr:unnamed protein product [Paramecium octaurelia]
MIIFIVLLFEQLLLPTKCKYLVLTDVTKESAGSLWSDETLSLPLAFCTNGLAENYIGVDTSLSSIYWKRIFTLPKTSRAYVYFEYSISGNWNNDELQVFANDQKVYSQKFKLTDSNRNCIEKLLYESQAYFVINMRFDALNFEIKVSAPNLGIYIKNLVLLQQQQRGRNEILQFIDYIPTCSPNNYFQQYYCKCKGDLVYQSNLCIATCGQNYLYDSTEKYCYQKDYCTACAGTQTTLTCDTGYYKYQESDITQSNCVKRCPNSYYQDETTKTCTSMQAYLQTNQNGGNQVDHYYFFTTIPEFLHFYTYNDFMVTVVSTPEKIRERAFFYYSGSFYVGSFETFQSQKVQITQTIQKSQHKLRFRAIAHFLDFNPSKFDVTINGVKQTAAVLQVDSINRLSASTSDYIAYLDYTWQRTELYPLTLNTILFEIEQTQQGGDYIGVFYLDDIHIFQFECQTGCNSCYTYALCTPCLFPANKNPADCTCLTGYAMLNNQCITCPTYCTTCVTPGVCVDCLASTKRINTPSCDQCPVSYYMSSGIADCQPCQTGCYSCTVGTACVQCANGYFRNQSNQCTTQCPDGQFNDSSNVNDPKCSICDNNCLKCQTTATNCIGCKGLAILVSGHCYLCSEGQYLSGTTCVNCIGGCQICSTVTCTTCQDSYYYKSSTNECLSVCDPGYFGNTTTKTCDPCDPNCLTCLGGTNKDCLTCSGGKVLNVQSVISGECQTNCLVGFYKVDNGCSKCWKGCSACQDQTQACLTCASKFYRLKTDNWCYETCPDGYYNNKVGWLCSPCNSQCKTCYGFSELTCLSCNAPLAYYQNECLVECYDGYGSINNICQPCAANCKSCFGTLPNECLACMTGFYTLNNQCYVKCPRSFIGIRPQYICKCIYDNCVTCTSTQFFLDNQCYDTCPTGYFGFNSLCIKCDVTCGTCFGEGLDECTTCNSGLVLYKNTCITECLGNLYQDVLANECKLCHTDCTACTGPNNNQCTACPTEKLLTIEHSCQVQCTDGSYPVVNELRCYPCHATCKTCFGPADENCLSCTNLFEANKCVSTCSVGFTINATGTACDSDFPLTISVCSYQCKTCELAPRFCKLCSGNRAPNPPNCDCEAGYFDDGANANCPKCANKCSTCKGLATLCLKCKGDRLLPSCNCPEYYYDDGESVNCVKCQDNCKTCDGSGCTSCLGDRITVPTCVCPDGYFDSYQMYCTQCAKKCITCNGSAELCTNCSGIRVSSPICGCPNGYFENSDLDCQQCDSTCKDCNQYGCLSCFGNRVGPINGECKCDTKGISRFSIGSVYCTDCSLGVPYFGLNDEFTGFTIDFGGSVALYGSLTGDSDSFCSAIFDEDTLSLLGTKPVCNDDLSIIFGDNPTIQVGDTIQLKPIFLLQGCGYRFLQILPNTLQIPTTIDQSTHKPSVRFTDVTSPNVCQPLTIKFEELFYNGKQKFKILSWNQILPVAVDPVIATILSSNKLNNSDTLIFPDRLFQSGVLYKFGAQVESFAKLQNQQTFQFQASQQSTITFKQDTLIAQYNRFQNIKIPTKISYANCVEKNPPQQLLYYEIILKNTKKKLLNGTLTENLLDGFQLDVPIEFPPFYFNFTNPYVLVFNTKLTRPDYTATSQSTFEIFIVPSSPVLTIAGGNRMLGFTQELFLNTTITDQDLTAEEAAKMTYTCNWICEDIVNGTACQNQMNETLVFDNNCNQYLPPRTFEPYKAVNFQVEILKENVNYSTKVSIQLIELDLPALTIQGADPLELHNYYDEFIFKLTYPGIDPDVLMYAGAVIYDQVVQATFQFYYLDFKFKIQDYFTNFDVAKGNAGRLRLSVYDPRFIMPSLNTQMLTLNIPPQKCELSYKRKESFVEFLDYLEVNVINCNDVDTPLKYSVMLFPNQSIYKSDLENSKFYHYLLVIPPQLTSRFNLTLPYANSDDSLIVVNIQDQQGGIANITEPLQIKQYANLSEDNIRNYQLRLQSFDERLIGYRIITDRLTQLSGLIDYKEELLNELLAIDKNDSFLSNQTETLYHSLSSILSQNVSLISLNETHLLNQLNVRIKLAATELVKLTELQHNNKLTSLLNIEKNNYVKQYYTYTNILSSYINYRVNKNETATEIQAQLDSMINYLQDISVANEPMYKVSSNSVNMNFGFLTSKLANEATGSAIKDSSKTRLLEAEADTSNSNYSSTTNFFKFSQTRFIDNPFYSAVGFPKNSTGYQAVDPKLAIQNAVDKTKNITSSMKMKFPTNKQLPTNTSTKCIAQVDSGSWNADVCKTKKAEGETICECESLNPTSIMESLDYLLDKASQVYSLDTLLAFASFPFYKTIVFYFYLLMTGGYAYVVYWGMKVDQAMYTRIAIEKEALEQKIKEEEDKLKEQEKKQEEDQKEENDGAVHIEHIDTQNDANQSKAILEHQEFDDVPTNNEGQNTIFNRNRMPQESKDGPIGTRGQVPTLIDINDHTQLIRPRRNSVHGSVQVIPSADNAHVAVDVQNATVNSQISPQNKVENADNPLQKEPEVTKKPQEDIVQQSISKLKAYIEYLKYFHQILSIVYKDDEEKPRGLRASIVYTSIMGSLAVLFVFGQPNNISLTLTLALLTAPVNKIYQVILEKMLAHKKKSVRIGGAFVMIVTAGFISYTMLAGLVLSGSVETANQWSYIFIGTFSADNLLYSPIQLVLQYGVHMGLINMPAIQRLMNKLLDSKAKEFLRKIFTRRR